MVTERLEGPITDELALRQNILEEIEKAFRVCLNQSQVRELMEKYKQSYKEEIEIGTSITITKIQAIDSNTLELAGNEPLTETLRCVCKSWCPDPKTGELICCLCS